MLEITEEWLCSASFPTGDGTTLHLWDATELATKDLYSSRRSSTSITDGVTVEAAVRGVPRRLPGPARRQP